MHVFDDLQRITKYRYVSMPERRDKSSWSYTVLSMIRWSNKYKVIAIQGTERRAEYNSTI